MSVVAVAQELLNGDFDFSKDEAIVVDPDIAEYATTPADCERSLASPDQVRFARFEGRGQGW